MCSCTAMNSGVMMPPAVDSPYWRSSWISSASSGGRLVEDPRGLLLGQGLDHVRRLVGRHLVEDPRGLALVERPQEGQPAALVHLVEHRARLLPGELAKHGHLVGKGQLPERGREICRVRLAQESGEGARKAVPEPPSELLDELRGVASFQGGGAYRRRGSEAGGGSRGGVRPGKFTGATPPLEESSREACERRG